MSCVFCAIAANQLPASIIYSDDLCLAFMDLYPLRAGHVLVVNRRHVQYVHELTDAERSHLLNVGSRIGQALRASSLKPVAFHFNINDGRAAHQTVPHVHLHVLPRYQGDNASFLASLLTKPLMLLKGGVKRSVLEQQAAELQTLLAQHD